jgi:hypothetical protein
MREEETFELDIPDGVAGASQAVELVRAFVADGSLMVALNTDAFGDQVVDWGRLLAQLGHHVARAAVLQGHMSEQEALAAVRHGFDSTLPANQPTLSGQVRGRSHH